MLEARYKSASTIKNIFNVLDGIVEEIKLVADRNGLIAKGLDESHACLFKLILSKNDFEEYKCDGTYELNIDIGDFVKILKTNRSSDQLILSHAPETKNLTISMKPAEGNRKGRRYNFALLESSSQGEVSLDRLEARAFQNRAIIDIDLIDSSLKAAEIVSTSVSIECKDGDFMISAEGSLGVMEDVIDTSDLKEGSSVTFTAKNEYAIPFIKKIIRAKEFTDVADIKFGSDENGASLPIRFYFTIGTSNSSLLIFLAPRVEEDEGEEDDLEDGEGSEEDEGSDEETEDEE